MGKEETIKTEEEKKAEEKLNTNYFMALGLVIEIYKNEFNYQENLDKAITRLQELPKGDLKAQALLGAMLDAKVSSQMMKQNAEKLKSIIPAKLRNLFQMKTKYEVETNQEKMKLTQMIARFKTAKEKNEIDKLEKDIDKIQKEINKRTKVEMEINAEISKDLKDKNIFKKIIPTIQEMTGLIPLYYIGKNDATRLDDVLKNDPALKDEKGQHKWMEKGKDSIFQYTAAPMQRTMRVSMSLEELQKVLKKIPGQNDLSEALESPKLEAIKYATIQNTLIKEPDEFSIYDSRNIPIGVNIAALSDATAISNIFNEQVTKLQEELNKLMQVSGERLVTSVDYSKALTPGRFSDEVVEQATARIKKLSKIEQNVEDLHIHKKELNVLLSKINPNLEENLTSLLDVAKKFKREYLFFSNTRPRDNDQVKALNELAKELNELYNHLSENDKKLIQVLAKVDV